MQTVPKNKPEQTYIAFKLQQRGQDLVSQDTDYAKRALKVSTICGTSKRCKLQITWHNMLEKVFSLIIEVVGRSNVSSNEEGLFTNKTAFSYSYYQLQLSSQMLIKSEIKLVLKYIIFKSVTISSWIKIAIRQTINE